MLYSLEFSLDELRIIYRALESLSIQVIEDRRLFAKDRAETWRVICDTKDIIGMKIDAILE